MTETIEQVKEYINKKFRDQALFQGDLERIPETTCLYTMVYKNHCTVRFIFKFMHYRYCPYGFNIHLRGDLLPSVTLLSPEELLKFLDDLDIQEQL